MKLRQEIRKTSFIKKKKNRKLFWLFFLIVFSISFLFLFVIYINFFYNGQIISPIPKITVNQKNNKETTNKLQEALTKNKIEFDLLSRTDQFLVIRLKDGAEIIFSNSKNTNEQISSLQLMLSRFTIEGKRIEKLDFRYDNPVVSFRK